MSYLRYVCLLPHSGVQHILYCVCFLILRLLYAMFAIFLDCLFLVVFLFGFL
jgi:hypothetical protein